jgi:ubiquinone/menaquinone biosynthesis C-methylase UbiE
VVVHSIGQRDMLKRWLYSQFGHPRGMVGWLAGRVMSQRNRERNVWLAQLLAPTPDAHLLEIGFGPGLAIEQFAPLLDSGHIAGIDRSQMMVQQATKRLQIHIKGGKVSLRRSDVHQLPFDDAQFDMIYAVNCMMFWEHPLEALAEIRRVLKPGGRFAVMRQPRGAQDVEEVRQHGKTIARLLEQTGLTEIDCQLRLMEDEACVCVLAVNP